MGGALFPSVLLSAERTRLILLGTKGGPRVNESGRRNVSLEEVTSLAAHDVNDAYLEELASVGLTKLTLQQILGLAAMGVDADYVRSMRAAGFEDASVDDLVRMKAMDVDADYVRELETLKKK